MPRVIGPAAVVFDEEYRQAALKKEDRATGAEAVAAKVGVGKEEVSEPINQSGLARGRLAKKMRKGHVDGRRERN